MMPAQTPLILVTGAAGFIGYHAAERLLRDGHSVLGVDNLNDYYDVQLKQARLERLQKHGLFQFEPLELSDEQSVETLFETFRPTLVLHLAAQAGVRHSLRRPFDYVRSNITGFLTVLEGCRRVGVRHLVYASSSSVYGDRAALPLSEHEAATHPVSLYAATKASNELMAHSYSHLFGLPTTGLRFFTVYGPWGRPDMAYYMFTKAILAGDAIELFNGGAMQRDFTYIGDCVDGIVGVLDRPPPLPKADAASDPASSRTAPFRVMNVGNDSPVSLMRFVEAIEAATGRTAKTVMRPMQPGDVTATAADIRELAALTGFDPSTTIEEGMVRFVAWYREYHRDSGG